MLRSHTMGPIGRFCRPAARTTRGAVALSALVLVCAALVLVPAVQANWSQQYLTPLVYSAEFSLVPDFDQRRDDFMNDGAMLCVPTAALNWMAYIAHHGYPFIEPGDLTRQEWHSEDSYPTVNSALSLMSSLMQTNAINGTDGFEAWEGLQGWLNETGSGYFFTINFVWLEANTPSFDGIASWVNMGVPVMGGVGWYDDDGTTIVRDGGHMFSVVKVERSGDQRWLTIHDPADDGDLDAQSAPSVRTYSIGRRVRVAMGLPRIVDKVLDYGSGYIDGYFAIRPVSGLATSHDGTQFFMIKPVRFSFDNSPTQTAIAAPLGAPIVGIVGDAVSPSVFLATEAVAGVAPARLWRFDPATGEYTDLAPLDDPVALEIDRFGRLYVLDGRTLRCWELGDGVPVEIASIQPPLPCTDLAIDDVNDLVLALCDGSVLPYDPRTLAARPAITIPSGVDLGGAGSLAVSPVDGALILTSELSPAVFRLDALGGVEVIGRNLVARPRDVSVGDGDIVYVVDGATNLTRAFAREPLSGEWAETATPPFAGLEVGSRLRIAHSRTNFDPLLHAGPDYRNVLPPLAASAIPGEPGSRAVAPMIGIAGVSPNPFNPSMTVWLEAMRAGEVTIRIHDVRGQLVRTLYQGNIDAGRHEVAWDGKDAGGGSVASGVYMVRLTTADGASRTVKITLTK